MIRHYLLSALANMRTAPFTTAAKVLTLALGLAVMILVSGVVTHWRSADKAITPAGDRALILTASTDFGELSIRNAPVTHNALARYLREDIPELAAVARFRSRGNVAADTGERMVVLRGANAEPQFLDIFQFDFLAGDPKTAMRQQDGIVLTQDAAGKLFGNQPALGRRVVLGGQRQVVVTGVIAPIPQPTHFDDGGWAFDYLSVMPPFAPGEESWRALSEPTYVLLPADGSLSLATLNRRLEDVYERRAPPEQKMELSYRGVPVSRLSEIILNGKLFGLTGGTVSAAGAFLGLGLLVLAISCLNYANLSTAQAASRVRESGMRQVLGAGKLGLLLQGWSEAALATLAALVLAALFLWLAAPVITSQAGIDMVGALAREPAAMGVVGLVAILVSVVAGASPALLASRARPVEALRSGRPRGGMQGLGRVFVGVQFASASALLILVIIVGQQNAHVRDLALQRSEDALLVLPPLSRSGVNVDTLRQQLAGYPEIKAVGERDGAPWSNTEGLTSLGRTRETRKGVPPVSEIRVGFGYFDANEQKLLAGRVFTHDRDLAFARETPSVAELANWRGRIVIDESYARTMGFATPQEAVGQLLFGEFLAFEIVGVVEDQPHAIQSEAEGGAYYSLSSGGPNSTPLVRIAASDVDRGVAAVREVWRRMANPTATDFRFEDEVFNESFRTFDRVGSLFMALSLVAFAIASVGLFGMAVHATQQRLQEIGVRKTLGSTVREVVVLLLADFSKPVVIANLMAWPLAYFGAQLYLTGFASQIDLTAWYFLLSLVITLSIAWLAVGAQTFKAASVRPAQVLRDA